MLSLVSQWARELAAASTAAAEETPLSNQESAAAPYSRVEAKYAYSFDIPKPDSDPEPSDDAYELVPEPVGRGPLVNGPERAAWVLAERKRDKARAKRALKVCRTAPSSLPSIFFKNSGAALCFTTQERSFAVRVPIPAEVAAQRFKLIDKVGFLD